ncbi:MAG: alanine--tRNA ligase [Chloroflexi bacterium]|nr:alanine--tRNA ligase [Chloroflexota bacterium]
MTTLTSDEIRALFLNFFQEKEHKVIPSSSLIPHGDPTLLLTTAGMVQFKPYFLGEQVPPAPRMASCQKCFRTTDVESVGDATHLTFFEMLGNFSIGDYFKKEAIAWGWEFVHERLKIPAEKLWITVYKDDDEAREIWRKIGIPEERILRCGEKDNFWGPAGSSGPCGPCSEIHYDFGEDKGCGKESCGPSCGCGRFSEVWNLVFTQYNQDEKGNRTPLPKPNIDTGMGLERLAAVLQGKPNVYGTDLFMPLIQKVSDLAGKKYGADAETDRAIRIVAEHSRGIPFLIADGVIPGNEGRGYVLRRLLRRASLFGKRVELGGTFLVETARTTIEYMGHVYPELTQHRDYIIKVVELEEARFNEVLNTGLELLENTMQEAASKGTKIISGEDGFRLYDTYGFPVEMTREIAAGRGFSVDMEGFQQEMEKQREKARAAQIPLWLSRPPSKWLSDLPSKRTEFSGYKLLKQKTTILSLLVGDESVAVVQEGQEASLILDITPFYAEMGGQVGDTGVIRSESGTFTVEDTFKNQSDIIVHRGRVSGGSLTVGDEVEAVVDRERRLDIARNHTATHLLQYALRRVLGKHVQQRGSLVAPERFRFDFSHLEAPSKEHLLEVQRIVNEKIRENLRVSAEVLSYKKAVETGAIALFGEKYGETVRMLKIGEPPVSMELCGGTHVNATGDIGFFRIVSESSIGSGLRRIEAVTGRGAESVIERQFSTLEAVEHAIGASPEDVTEKVSAIVAELENERKRTLGLERELSRKTAESLVTQVEMVNGIKVLVSKVPSTRIEVLREMLDLLRERLGSAVIVLGTVQDDRPLFLTAVTPDLVARGYSAGEIVKQVAKVAGGGGGGKPTLAQAGGKNKEKLDESLAVVKSLIKK